MAARVKEGTGNGRSTIFDSPDAKECCQLASDPSSGLRLDLVPAFSSFQKMASLELVADYSGATAPEFHGLPIISAKDVSRITNARGCVNPESALERASRNLKKWGSLSPYLISLRCLAQIK
jgi:hypothetical protein